MGAEILVDDQIEDGGKLLSELVRSGFDVTVAAWVHPSEEALWSLYIGSNSVSPETLADAFRKVYNCLSKLPESAVSFSDIKLVHTSNSVAQDAIAARDRHPARICTWYHGKRLGNLSIEEAYIYPPIAGSLSPGEVLQAVLALINRPNRLDPATFTLRDGSVVRAVPTGIQARQPGAVQITLRDVTTNADRVVEANEVVNIL